MEEIRREYFFNCQPALRSPPSRPNRNCNPGSHIRRRQHVASPIKNSSRINHHARRMHFPSDHALRLNLHAALSENHSVKSPCDYHPIAFNLPFNLRAFAQYYRVLRNDIALHDSVNAKCSGDLQRAFQRHPLINKSGPLFRDVITRCAGPFPGHEILRRDSSTVVSRATKSTQPIPNVSNALPDRMASPLHPPAIAPIIKSGSTPETTASGSGASTESCDKSPPHAKNRKNGRRSCVTCSRIVPRSIGNCASNASSTERTVTAPCTSSCTSP